MKTRLLPHAIVAATGLAALAGGAALYQAKRPAELRMTGEQLAATDPAAAATPLHVRGKPTAPVTIEEFADLQCPPCAGLAEPINGLEKTFRGSVRVIFRHFPIFTHAHAREAAWAAEAAGLQGRFWEMHDLLYREQAGWSQAPAVRPLFEAYAGTLGLDLGRFGRDFEGEVVKARVAADEQRGAALGVRTTPTIFVNETAVPAAALRPDALRALVAAAVQSRTARQP